MIPVELAKEPDTFEAAVRRPGRAWLVAHKIPDNEPLPANTELKPSWRDSLDDLHRAYDGVCAYACVFVERMTGGVSTDHYVAKSRRAGLAYEWNNYRLACSTMNGRKWIHDTILDPIGLAAETFRLELVTGRIYPRPTLSAVSIKQAQDTIDDLGLDDAGWRDTRARHYEGYCLHKYGPAFLREYSPFVWHEATRQNLL
jgi:hypothetical protein